MFRLRIGAGDEGIQARQPVHKPMRHEKFERPVNDDRCRPALGPRHLFKDFIGTRRRMAFCDDLEHLAPFRGQPHPPGRADPFRFSEDTIRT